MSVADTASTRSARRLRPRERSPEESLGRDLPAPTERESLLTSASTRRACVGICLGWTNRCTTGRTIQGESDMRRVRFMVDVEGGDSDTRA